MDTPKNYCVEQKKKIRCARAGRTRRIGYALFGTISLIAASGFALITPIVVAVSPCFAAPLLPPPWMLQLVDDWKNLGRLTQTDIDQLIKSTNGSFKNLKSIVDRLNQIAASQGLNFRFQAQALILVGGGPNPKVLEARIGDTVTFRLLIVNQTTGQTIGEYDLGKGKYDG
jgi:hypothetical protein